MSTRTHSLRGTSLVHVLHVRIAALIVAVLLIPPSLEAADPPDAPTSLPEISVGSDDPGFVDVSRSVAIGGSLAVTGLVLEGEPASQIFDLERVEVWAPDAIFEVDGKRREPPDTRFFSGIVRGFSDSIVTLTLSESGEARGVVSLDSRQWVLTNRRSQEGPRGLVSKLTDLESLDKPFHCDSDSLTVPPIRQSSSPVISPRSHSTEPYIATVAAETDYEFYARFLSSSDPVTAAFDYLGSIISYGDVVYSREVDTELRLGYARLWTSGASGDPWTVTSSTSSALNQYVDYWNANQQHIERTVAHFFSGKNLGGGIAYVGVLCQNYQFPGSSVDYGLSANLEGDFQWNGSAGSDPSTVVWDIVVVLHELGHNFNSPHTQDYCNLGGSTQPVDRCFSGCAGSGVGLPSCSSPTPHFDGGAGTLMSYCHLLTGGMSNISLTLGAGHTCGTLPQRVPDRMNAHVSTRASTYPTCFDPSVNLLTVSKDGSGSGTVTSNPTGIDCGSDCEAAFADGTSVTLSASPASGSTFDGWSGSGCSGTGSCTVTMSATRAVNATFGGQGGSCPPDVYETSGADSTDDTCFGAFMSVGASQTHTLCDEDWVWFNSTAGATYRIETSGLFGGADTTLALHDLCGPQLAFNDDFNGLASRIEWTATTSTSMDIRIRNYADIYGSNKGYTINVTCIANCPEECPDTLDLTSQTVTGTEAFKASSSIGAGDGFVVGGAGDVLLQAGSSVALRNGFSVLSGGRLTVLTAPPTCPLSPSSSVRQDLAGIELREF